MEAILGISLYTYLYPKLAKTICLSYYVFSSIKSENWFILEVGGKGEMAQIIYTHVSNVKMIKGEKEKTK
jgi:hypothetical protein